MAGTQSYIGIKNGVVLCIDHYLGYDMNGLFYHGYSLEPVHFGDGAELLRKLENLFDILNFPYAVTNERNFEDDAISLKRKRKPRVVERPYTVNRLQDKEREKVMSDKDILTKHGDAGTFIVRVQQRQNSSWQGRITWVDEDKTVYFRSVFEMMKLIDAALKQSGNSEDEGTEMNWE